jgi:hypothetical protein
VIVWSLHSFAPRLNLSYVVWSESLLHEAAAGIILSGLLHDIAGSDIVSRHGSPHRNDEQSCIKCKTSGAQDLLELKKRQT